jgi:threonine dehydrogenase-like Zn-dependent dehydrogenase
MAMLALRKQSPGCGLQLAQVDEPEALEPTDVLLRVRSVGVCGTDLHIDEWTPSYHFMAPNLPVTLGHEFSGEVVCVGDQVQGVPLGSLVTVRPSVVCGRCSACVSGQHDACVVRRGIGVTRDGAFAQWVRVPARNCVSIAAGIEPEVAALAEPLSVGLESVRTGEVGPGQRVLILGPGNIGQAIALFARAAGAAQVVIAGRDDAPRLAVLAQMGFTDLLDVAASDTDAALAGCAGADGFDVVIEATGSSAVVASALRVLRPRGILVITGIHAEPVPIDLAALVRRHHQVRGSYRAPEAAWPQVVQFMAQHQALLRLMVTHRVSLADAHEAIALARSRQATKVMVMP